MSDQPAAFEMSNDEEKLEKESVINERRKEEQKKMKEKKITFLSQDVLHN